MFKTYYFNVISSASETAPEHERVEVEAFAGINKALYAPYSDRDDYVTVTTLSAQIESDRLLTAGEAIAAASEISPSLFSIVGRREFFKGARESYKGAYKAGTSFNNGIKRAAANMLLRHVNAKTDGRED